MRKRCLSGDSYVAVSLCRLTLSIPVTHNKFYSGENYVTVPLCRLALSKHVTHNNGKVTGAISKKDTCASTHSVGPRRFSIPEPPIQQITKNTPVVQHRKRFKMIIMT